MIYLDNAATTLYKPQEVDAAILDALHTAGNPGRGAHEPTLHASRLVYAAREALAELFHAPDPACIAFTANATGALNTALCGLLGPGDHVITTVCEHNSVLRPLYRLRTQGVQLSFAGVDAKGHLQYEKWEELVRPNTRALVVTGASNVTGNCTDLAKAAAFAHRHGLLLIVDAAQTAGAQSIDVQALGVDVLCFTGHKALLGPQGTGGLYVRPGVQIAPLVVGGSGVHSYDEQHPAQMPTALEAGTLNVHGLAGLCAGVQWLLTQGVETLAAREAALARCFYEEVCGMPGVTVYGDIETALRAPIVSDIQGGLRHLCAGRSTLRPADAQGAWHGGTGRGTVQLFTQQYHERSSARCTGRAGAGTGAVNAHKKDLYRALLPHNGGSHGLGEALRRGTDPRAADPAPTGDLRRVRPCLAHDAGGLGTLEQPAGPGGLRRGVAGGAMTNRRTFYERIG